MGAAEWTESLCLPAIATIPVGLYVPLLEFNRQGKCQDRMWQGTFPSLGGWGFAGPIRRGAFDPRCLGESDKLMKLSMRASLNDIMEVSVRVNRYADGGLAVFHGPRKLARYGAEGKQIKVVIKRAAQFRFATHVLRQLLRQARQKGFSVQHQKSAQLTC